MRRQERRQRGIAGRMQRIGHDRTLGEFDRLSHLPDSRQKIAEIGLCLAVVRGELQLTAEFGFGSEQIHVRIERQPPARTVRRRQVRIQSQCRGDGSARLRIRLACRGSVQVVGGKLRPGVGQFRMGKCVVRIEPGRRGVEIDGTPIVDFAPALLMELALQIGVVGRKVAAWRAVALHHASTPAVIRRPQPGLQCCRHRRSDVVLQCEQILVRPLEILRPQRGAVTGLDQLDDDTHLPPGSTHAALEQVGRTQLVAHTAAVFLAAAEAERGIAGDHLQFARLRQRDDQILGQPVGKIQFLVATTLVAQWQHRDRLFRHVLDFGMRHEGIDQQQHDDQAQCADDPEIQLPAGFKRDRGLRFDLAFALDAFRCPLVEPGEQHRRHERDRQRQHQPAHYRDFDAEKREHLAGDLHQQPCSRGVEGRGAENVATPEFGKQAHRGAAPIADLVATTCRTLAGRPSAQ